MGCVPCFMAGEQQPSSLRVLRSQRVMATKPVPWQTEGLGQTDGRLGPTHGDEEQQGAWETESTLQNRCFVPACATGRRSPERLWAAIVGLPERFITGGTPSAAHSLALVVGGLSPPNWAREEGAALPTEPAVPSAFGAWGSVMS